MARRLRDRGLRWVAEAIAEQRLLWHLRRQHEATLVYPDDLDGTQAMAITLAEWEGVQDRRWLARNTREWVAEEHGRITASLRLSLTSCR